MFCARYVLPDGTAMRYGIIADIHGNLEAFESVLESLSRAKIEKYLCAGDIIGYGADPRECIKMTRELDAVAVLGNHDAASAGLIGMDYFNDVSAKAVKWTKQNMEENDFNFLKSIGFTYVNKHLTLVHGTLRKPSEFNYMTDPEAAGETFNLMKTDICFIGHTHVPGVFSLKGGELSYSRKKKTAISAGERLIVNVGSVGQPRDGDPRSCYAVYDTDEASVVLKRVAYDVKKAQKKILKTGLSPFLADRLGAGV